MTTEERIIETEKKLARIAAIASGTEKAPQRADVGFSAWLGPLMESWERRISELEESVAMGSYRSRHALNELETCLKDLRACAESGSNDGDQAAAPGAVQRHNQKGK